MAIAEKAFAEYGYDGVSAKTIAEKAGVTIGAFYHYFPSKEAIYDAVTKKIFEERSSVPSDIFDDSDSPEDKLAKLVGWFIHNITEDQIFGQILQRELIDPKSHNPNRLIKGYFKNAYLIFRDLLSQLVPTEKQDTAFASLLAMCLGFANMQGMYAMAPSLKTAFKNADEIGFTITNILLNGTR